MKVGIVGSREFTDYDKFLELLGNQSLNITTVISGGAVGTDSLARRFALDNNIPLIEHLPEYSYWGNKAPLIRNTDIVNDSEMLVAFVTSSSRGTWDTIKKAKRKGINVKIINL